MDDDLPMPDLLGGDPGPAPGADELHRIVRAARRHQRRAAAGVMAAVLGAGVGGGYLIARNTGPSATRVGVAAGPAVPPGSGLLQKGLNLFRAATGTASSSASAVAIGAGPTAATFTPAFVRTAGAVTIRGFLTGYGTFTEPPGCTVPGPPQFVAEISTAKLATQVEPFTASVDRKSALSDVAVQLTGEQESDPTAVVMAATTCAEFPKMSGPIH